MRARRWGESIDTTLIENVVDIALFDKDIVTAVLAGNIPEAIATAKAKISSVGLQYEPYIPDGYKSSSVEEMHPSHLEVQWVDAGDEFFGARV